MNQRPSELSEQSSINPSLPSASGRLEQHSQAQSNKAGASEDDRVVSLVHQPIQLEEEDLAVFTDEQISFQAHLEDSEIPATPLVDSPSVNPIQNSLIDSLLTPWGIGSSLLLLIANGLLSWAVLSNSQPIATTQTAPGVTSLLSEQSQAPSNSLALNLTPAQSPQLDLKTLSTLEPKPSAPVALKLPTPARPTPAPTATSKPVAPQPTSSLTTALLPPSLRPQSAPQPYLPSPPAVVPASAPITITPPAPPTSPALTALPPPPPLPAPTKTVTLPDLTNAQIREQAQQEAEASSVSFPQSTRLKMQAAQNQVAPQQLIDELQQLNQEESSNSAIPVPSPSVTNK